MPETRAVGFDLDGTLFDHHGSAVDGLDDFLRGLGVEPSGRIRSAWFAAEDAGFQQWCAGELSFQEQRRYRLRAMLPALALEIPHDDGALDDLFDRYLTAYRGAWRLFPGAVGLLRALRADGLRIGVLTNGSEAQQLDKLRRTGLQRLVDVVCTAESIGTWKPDERAFRELARRLGVEPGECLFVGDDPEQDIAGAEAAGMQAVTVNHYAEESTGFDDVFKRLGLSLRR